MRVFVPQGFETSYHDLSIAVASKLCYSLYIKFEEYQLFWKFLFYCNAKSEKFDLCIAKDAYECSSYKLRGQRRPASCSNHHISTKALRALILETIKTASVYAVSNQEEFMEKVRAASQLRQAETLETAKWKPIKDRKRITELDGIIKKLYESFAVGRVSEECFDGLLAEYEAEQRMLRDGVAEAEQQIAVFNGETANAGEFLVLAKKYTDFSELTTPMINEFIEKVVVHAPDRSDGDRV